MIFNHAVNTSTAGKQLCQGADVAAGAGPDPLECLVECAGRKELCLAEARGGEINNWLEIPSTCSTLFLIG